MLWILSKRRARVRKFKGYSVSLEPHVISERAGNPRPLTRADVADWPDEYLAFATVVGNQTPYNHEVVARELRRREAWDAPAAMAFRISIMALVISAVGAFLSAYGLVWHGESDARCAAIERDMLSAHHRMIDGPDVFRALGCRPQVAGSIRVPPTDREILANRALVDGGYPSR